MPISGKRRRIKIGFMKLFLLFLLLFSYNASSLPCNDNRCKTGSCNDTGACICNLLSPSTILDGDRPFLGGRFCDEEQIMCDGTNSFWCEHGGNCVEIVHGENYTCKCPPGYTGLHCEHKGAPCDQIFCFHEAECLVEGDFCDCPPNWRGSVDCSLPTKTNTDSVTDSTTTGLPHVESSNNMKWFVVEVLATLCSLGAVVAAVILTKRFLKKNEMTTPKFQQLSQMQTHGFFDDDEDSEVPEVIRNNNSHL
ncbi:hypothetical protein HHK36_027672 [Tetracentron sinense]|uniref:EGF-like domain-containing protein n=1 Tax=Tetracentron sinense TaxID=13715 RepID=A0A834YJK2_TETSI|nr:hypothetical protein HHK36_027672 [Tetracentron sinense]